jgi:multiple antibiotic resistance protein
MDTFSATVMLFLIMDPLGNVPTFLSVLKDIAPRRRRVIIIRELLFALVILLLFLFLGQYLLDFLKLKQESISIAGGIVLFLIALKMIFPSEGGVVGTTPEGEPFIVPLAIPLVAGPSTLAALLLLVRSQPGRMRDWFVAMVVAWALSSVILLSSNLFHRLLKERGIIAMERLMGMLLVTVSVQMFLDGIAKYLSAQR